MFDKIINERFPLTFSFLEEAYKVKDQESLDVFYETVSLFLDEKDIITTDRINLFLLHIVNNDGKNNIRFTFKKNKDDIVFTNCFVFFKKKNNKDIDIKFTISDNNYIIFYDEKSLKKEGFDKIRKFYFDYDPKIVFFNELFVQMDKEKFELFFKVSFDYKYKWIYFKNDIINYVIVDNDNEPYLYLETEIKNHKDAFKIDKENNDFSPIIELYDLINMT